MIGTIPTASAPLDPRQLIRIEAVHRGFLYQHLYAAACLLSANKVGVSSIVVEQDEDVEIVLATRRIYVQVKTRSNTLAPSDIDDAMQRFDALRAEHLAGVRQGRASFVVAANVPPGAALVKRLERADWPVDVHMHWPEGPTFTDETLPRPWHNITDALENCAELAASLPFGLLAPETLVWKLAGCVMLAAAGNPPRNDHSFSTVELPQLFEQLVVQLQEFPTSPIPYRSQTSEPPILSAERVRIITGFSGSGKTSWVSQAAQHTIGSVAYFDVIDTPGQALATSLARELAAKYFGNAGGGLGEILLPGASGAEILQATGDRLAANGEEPTLVLDNAHSVPAPDLRLVIQQAKSLKFVLLCQPGRSVQELESLLSVTSEPLRGWATDTIAQEVEAKGCQGDLAACEQLLNLTGGMPLYVQNALAITAAEYAGSVPRFCIDLEAKTHTVETAQEIILSRAFDSLPEANRDVVSVLSLSDIPLERSETAALVMQSLGLNEKAFAAILRQLRPTGSIEVFGGNRLKIHNAMRLLGQSHLVTLGDEVVRKAQIALKDLLSASFQRQWEMQKVSLYFRMLAAIGDIKTLVQLSTDELFHELGSNPEIMAFLESAADSEKTPPEDRFWALDGLVFADMKQGDFQTAAARQDVMARLIVENGLGVTERLALAIKRMNVAARQGEPDEVRNAFAEALELLPNNTAHLRIFRYNAAHALFDMGQYEESAGETRELIEEYYSILGLSPEDVFMRNPDKIWPLLKKYKDINDDLKHLADCLDLNSKAVNSIGCDSGFARINAMKFYTMAQAFNSLFRVGQDLVDEFLGRHEYVGARELIETNILPNVLKLKMVAWIIPIRSQYAVVLAYCGDFDAADTEMSKLTPYESGLSEKGQWELRNQRKMIAGMRLKSPRHNNIFLFLCYFNKPLSILLT